MKRCALIVLAACGSSDEPAPAPAPVAIAEPPPPRPAPGMDLAGPLAAPDNAPGPRKPAVPIDLAADRAVVKVDVPVAPRGGAVGFSFGDDRRGWVTGIPDAQQLPAVAYANDRVYVSGGFQSTSFYALAASTGRIEWATTSLEDNGPTAAVVEGDDVLFNTESCTLFALDAKTGKRKWFKYLGDPTLAQVAVTDGLVYAAHPPGRNEQVAYWDGSQTMISFYLSAYRAKRVSLIGCDVKKIMVRAIQPNVRNTPMPVIPRHPLLHSGSLVPSGTVGGWPRTPDRGYRVSRWSKNRPIHRRAWDAGCAPAAEPPPGVNRRSRIPEWQHWRRAGR